MFDDAERNVDRRINPKTSLSDVVNTKCGSACVGVARLKPAWRHAYKGAAVQFTVHDDALTLSSILD